MKRKAVVFVLSIALLLLAGIAAMRPLPENVAQGEAATELPVLVYHAVHMNPFSAGGMTNISYGQFAGEMRYLYEQGYKTLSMEEAVRFMQGDRKFPPKVVVITFDDGLVSSLYAIPVLVHYGFKATFFVIPGFAQPDPAKPGADSLYMSWPTLWALSRVPGIEISSHTLTHPWEKGQRLTDWVSGQTAGKTPEDARFELTESKRLLEEHLKYKVLYLDWPTGIYDDTLINMAKDAGYKASVTTGDGVNRPGGDAMRMHRTIVHGACGLESFKKILITGRYQGC
jgi:peptidoglycan/xylan/chitin deacetylase (PgdA/CDA1 family)